MDNNSVLNNYIQLNKSFERKLLFRLGGDAGFFSEYNNMILAMLYCLKNKIQFVLYSKNANFSHVGWNDYFLPFCEEIHNTFNDKYNIRYYDGTQLPFSIKDRFKIKIHKTFNGINFFTQDLWRKFHNRQMEKEHYTINEIGVNGNIREACQMLINMTWRYTDDVQKKVNILRNNLHLPEKYLGFHIRRGDKSIEADLVNYATYIEKAESLSSTRVAFVLTDDYTVIDDLRRQYKNWSFYTLCAEYERGYIYSEFKTKSQDEIKNAHIKLFASIDLLANSEITIGTFSSNPGMYLGMRSFEKFYGVDMNEWQIW